MPRGPELSKELHDYIYDHYVFFHESQHAIMNSINNDTALVSKFGRVAIADIHYHVKQIRKELENMIDMDALDKYTAEYVRYGHSIESEIEDVEKIIALCDTEKDKEIWLKLKRHKRELMETKLRALQDHELPLVVKKLKRERDSKQKVLKLEQAPEALPKVVDSDGT